MTDRLDAALAELAAAIRAEVRAEAVPVGDAPERLLSVNQAGAALGGIGRSLVYDLIGSGGSGALQSLKVGRRRLIPASAIEHYIATKAAGL